MDMSVVKDWEFTLGKTLPHGVWPLSVPKMKAPEPEALPAVMTGKPCFEVSGAGYAKAKDKWFTGTPFIFGTKVVLKGFIKPRIEPLPEVVPVTIKLSHAIRLGAQRLIQVYGLWGDGKKFGCALTAALVGADRFASRNAGVHSHWPHVPGVMFSDIVSMNDSSFKSFSQIADYVEAQGY